jgi:hypothetical protein
LRRQWICCKSRANLADYQSRALKTSPPNISFIPNSCQHNFLWGYNFVIKVSVFNGSPSHSITHRFWQCPVHQGIVAALFWILESSNHPSILCIERKSILW